jgi:hypothetical protein
MMSGTSSFKYGFKLKQNKNLKTDACAKQDGYMKIRSLTKTQMTNRKTTADRGTDNSLEHIRSTPKKYTAKKNAANRMKTSEILVRDHLL